MMADWIWRMINWEKYNMVYYSPVYAVVMSSSKNLENCIKFLEMMVQ